MRNRLLLLCLAASTALAATVQFTAVPVNREFGTYNGFVPAVVDDVPGQWLICDDYDHTTYVPSPELTYSVSILIGPNPLQYARFADSSKYEEAAFLLEGLSTTGPGSLLDLTADYQYALWRLFTAGAPLPSVTAQTLLDDAAAAVARGDLGSSLLYSRLRIYTPVSSYASNQEFLQLLPAAGSQPWTVSPSYSVATPEPSAAWLIATGIGLMVVGFGVRRAGRGRPARTRGSALP